MKNFKIKAIGTILALLFAGLYYYITLPAINIHASGFWFFIMLLFVVVTAIYILRRRLRIEEIKLSKTVNVLIWVESRLNLL